VFSVVNLKHIKHMKKNKTQPAQAATPAETKAESTSTKGQLVGRGAYVMQLAAREVGVATFTSAVREKYPMTSVPWCERHYKRALGRIAKRAAAAAPAPAPVPEKSTKKSKKTAAKS